MSGGRESYYICGRFSKDAEHCDYGDVLNDTLRDHIVYGIFNKPVHFTSLFSIAYFKRQSKPMLKLQIMLLLQKQQRWTQGAYKTMEMTNHLQREKERLSTEWESPKPPKVRRKDCQPSGSLPNHPKLGGSEVKCYRGGGKHQASYCRI